MFLLDLVFPDICLVCGDEKREVIPGTGTCEDCGRRYAEYHPARCAFCGAVLPDATFGTSADCRFCREHLPILTGLISLGEYQDDEWLQQAILRMKHGSRTEISRCLGYMLGRKIRNRLPDVAFHGVTAAPLHFTRYWRRGYNQAELVAKAVARYLGIPSYGWLLKRRRRTKPQSGGPSQRKMNVHDAFSAAGTCRGASMILVDDVFTTGATTVECAKTLHRAGAKEVLIATCAWVRKIQ